MLINTLYEYIYLCIYPSTYRSNGCSRKEADSISRVLILDKSARVLLFTYPLWNPYLLSLAEREIVGKTMQSIFGKAAGLGEGKTLNEKPLAYCTKEYVVYWCTIILVTAYTKSVFNHAQAFHLINTSTRQVVQQFTSAT